MSKYIQMTKKNIRYWNTTFRLIKTKFNNYNLGMNIESQSGKAPKKGKKMLVEEKRIKIQKN